MWWCAARVVVVVVVLLPMVPLAAPAGENVALSSTRGTRRPPAESSEAHAVLCMAVLLGSKPGCTIERVCTAQTKSTLSVHCPLPFAHTTILAQYQRSLALKHYQLTPHGPRLHRSILHSTIGPPAVMRAVNTDLGSTERV